jgi:hypothetical protein
MRNLIVNAVVAVLFMGGGLTIMWQGVAMGIVSPPTPLSDHTVKCQEKGRQNKMYPDVYELLRTKGGCDMLSPYNVAYPEAPVPLSAMEATNTQGKPQGGQ